LSYLIVFVCSFFATYLIKNYAIKNALVAEVNERSSHTVATPHGGGIAIAITWFGALFSLHVSHQIESTLYYALMLGMVLALVSYLDDLFELSPKIRLFTQSGVALGALFFLGGLVKIDFGIFELTNPFLLNIFAFFLIVWFINLYNFLDGIDGYAGSEAIFLALAGFFLFGGAHFIVLAVAVLGFLIWNWQRAKIFMGDVGSTLLGYNVAIFTIYYADKASVNLWIWIILFGVFWFDATLTLFRRFKNKEKLSQAHRKHAYQRLTQSGWSHQKVVLASIMINLILLAIVYFVPKIFLAFVISLIVLYLTVLFVDRKKGFE
jgi:Fuc2NAc and GlcNAc transferase